MFVCNRWFCLFDCSCLYRAHQLDQTRDINQASACHQLSLNKFVALHAIQSKSYPCPTHFMRVWAESKCFCRKQIWAIFFFSHSRFHSLINGGLLRFIKKRNWYCFSTIVFVALGLPGFGVSGLRHNCAGDQNWPGRAFVSISHPRQQSVNINFERYCSLRRLSTDSVHFSPVLFPLFS